jgi:polyferredoxin
MGHNRSKWDKRLKDIRWSRNALIITIIILVGIIIYSTIYIIVFEGQSFISTFWNMTFPMMLVGTMGISAFFLIFLHFEKMKLKDDIKNSCPNCGRINRSAANYCDFCGSFLNGTNMMRSLEK